MKSLASSTTASPGPSHHSSRSMNPIQYMGAAMTHAPSHTATCRAVGGAGMRHVGIMQSQT